MKTRNPEAFLIMLRFSVILLCLKVKHWKHWNIFKCLVAIARKWLSAKKVFELSIPHAKGIGWSDCPNVIEIKQFVLLKLSPVRQEYNLRKQPMKKSHYTNKHRTSVDDIDQSIYANGVYFVHLPWKFYLHANPYAPNSSLDHHFKPWLNYRTKLDPKFSTVGCEC